MQGCKGDGKKKWKGYAHILRIEIKTVGEDRGEKRVKPGDRGKKT